MSVRSIAALGALALFAPLSTVQAGVLFSTIPSQNIFGTTYQVDIYRVTTDLSSQGFSPAAGRLEPEGMVWHNGVLYVTGDGSTAEANGYMAAYAGGNLGASPTATRYTASFVNALGNTVSAAYGPEGITVNTRGVGIGGAGGFVGIDSVVSPVSQRILASMPAGGGVVTNAQVGAAFNYDDITFVPGAANDGSEDRFAVIDASGTTPVLTYLSAATGLPTGVGSFPLADQDKGLLFLPAAQANLFIPGTDQDVLMVARGPVVAGDQGRLLLFSLTGTLLGDSPLPTGTGPGLLANIEALAYDPIGQRLFIGDENGTNSQIAVIQIPAPAAAALLGLGALVAGRRRR